MSAQTAAAGEPFATQMAGERLAWHVGTTKKVRPRMRGLSHTACFERNAPCDLLASFHEWPALSAARTATATASGSECVAANSDRLQLAVSRSLPAAHAAAVSALCCLLSLKASTPWPEMQNDKQKQWAKPTAQAKLAVSCNAYRSHAEGFEAGMQTFGWKVKLHNHLRLGDLYL